ncbi:MAG: hypothetical protein ACREOF_08925 [Gemmatimonadales bacterium]
MLGYIVGFWAFLFSPTYRAHVLRTWHAAGWPKRGLLLLDGVVAIIVGVGLPLFLGWLLVAELRA